MKIAIDLRSLHTGKISGVENYIINVIEHLLPLDHANQYTLFYNGFSQVDFGHYRFVNSTIVQKGIPNKLLNLSLKFISWPKFENLFGDFDVLFQPNFNYFSIKPKTKLAVTVHDMSPVLMPEVYSLKRRLWHGFLNFRKTLDRADIIFAVSEFTKRDIIKLYNIHENKIVVAYPAINHHLFKPELPEDKLREIRNVYGLPGRYLLFLNTIEPRKNIIRLIEAYEKLDDPIDLVLGGKPGWKYGPIFSKIESSKKRRSIKYLGYIPEEDKPYIIKLATAVLAPSLYEGFGFPALEALAVGIPVMTSQITSLPEVVNDAALLVNPYNVDDMAKAMDELIKNAVLRQQLVKKGLKQAQKFQWETTAQTILQGLNSLTP